MKLKAFKFRLEPNKQQKIMFNKTLGCTRLIYNQMLNERQEKYGNKDKSTNKTEKEYKNIYPFMKEIDSISLQQARIDL
jgi:putative transposase